MHLYVNCHMEYLNNLVQKVNNVKKTLILKSYTGLKSTDYVYTTLNL